VYTKSYKRLVSVCANMAANNKAQMVLSYDNIITLSLNFVLSRWNLTLCYCLLLFILHFQYRMSSLSPLFVYNFVNMWDQHDKLLLRTRVSLVGNSQWLVSLILSEQVEDQRALDTSMMVW